MMVPQFSFWPLALVAVIHCLVFATTVNAELAFVRPNSSVLCSASSSQQPCLTFNEYAQQVNQYFVNDTTFLFLPGTHRLDIGLYLKPGLSNISLVPLNEGINNDAVQLLIGPSANITWDYCVNIEISGFIFVLSEVTSVPELVFYNTTARLTNLTLVGNGARLFVLCLFSAATLQISNLTVKGIRAPVLYAQFESTITFYGQSTFYNNTLTSSGYTSAQYGLIQLSFGASCYIHRHGSISFIQNGINISDPECPECNSLYEGGAAISIYGSVLVISGIASFVSSRSTNNINGGAIYAVSQSSVVFEESASVSFIENYAASGGAMYLSESNLTMCGRVLFERNSADCGGAIAIDERCRLTTINCSERNVIFRNNIGQSYGGAIYSGKNARYCYSESEPDSGTNSDIELRDVLFEGNAADEGGAIYALGQGVYKTTNVELRDAYFERNMASNSGGALYTATASVELRDVWFERNTVYQHYGGAVHAISTFINMTGTLSFVKNSAYQGGAIAFGPFGSVGNLLLLEPLMATFSENSAKASGGVVFYYDDTCANQMCVEYPDRFFCFIEFSTEDIINIRLNFTNNSAEIAGRIFYGGYLDKCTPLVNGKPYYNVVYHEALNLISSMSNVNIDISNYNDNTTSNVSSDPLQVCICESDGLECDRIKTEIVVGREFTFPAVIVGQGLGAFPSAVRISLDSDAQLGSPLHRIQSTGKACTNITYSLFSEKNNTMVTLFPDNGPCRDLGIGHLRINITFLPCPNGFVKNGSECVCEERLQKFNAVCYVSTNSIQWTSNRFWMGAIYGNYSDESSYQGLILHSGCPLDYCVDNPVPITLDNLDIQCNHNHSGTLCGSCREGYSIALGTLHCLPNCSNDYLALILPFALAGIALVAVLLLLRLTVTAGTIQGLIFYANVVQANTSFFFPPGETNVLTVFIAWMNLDFGIETCFYYGMTTYAYTWLQFVFPFYVWFLIGMIIVATHYSTKLTRLFGKNPVAALATLFLLSYSKLLRTIIATLSFAMLQYPDDNRKSVWFYDGNVAYGSTKHAILVIFAILVLVFLFIPYTLLLFFAHWLQALSHWRILSWLNKIKPFIDTYHAPYKKQTRYWTGLLLFMRLFLFAFDAIINDELISVVITSITVILASLAWMHKGVYENYFNNILEAFFIANLCIFAVATLYNQTNKPNWKGTPDLFVGLAFIVFICIVLFHIYLVLRETAMWKKMPKPTSLLCKEEKKKDLPPQGDGDDRIVSFMVKAPPTQTTVDLCEPLLEQ